MVGTKHYKELSTPSKKYAAWDLSQRNAVSKYRGAGTIELKIENCLFYSNGVFAKTLNT